MQRVTMVSYFVLIFAEGYWVRRAMGTGSSRPIILTVSSGNWSVLSWATAASCKPTLPLSIRQTGHREWAWRTPRMPTETLYDISIPSVSSEIMWLMTLTHYWYFWYLGSTRLWVCGYRSHAFTPPICTCQGFPLPTTQLDLLPYCKGIQ